MHALRTDSPHVSLLKKMIASGVATNGLWPAVWLEITAKAEDIVENLKGREIEGVNTSSDPAAELEQVERYLCAQHQVLEFVKQVPATGNVRFVEISNPRVDPRDMDSALKVLALQVIQNLPLRG